MAVGDILSRDWGELGRKRQLIYTTNLTGSHHRHVIVHVIRFLGLDLGWVSDIVCLAADTIIGKSIEPCPGRVECIAEGSCY